MATLFLHKQRESIMDETNKQKSSSADNDDVRMNRRKFLGAGAAAAALGAAKLLPSTTTSAVASTEADTSDNIVRHSDFPVKISKDYKPFPQRKTAFSRIFNPAEPELGKLLTYYKRREFHEDKAGMNQVSFALDKGASSVDTLLAMGAKAGLPNSGVYSWEQRPYSAKKNFFDNNLVAKERYQFKSKQEAADVIKRAARFYGADLVGITYPNEKWDYAPLFHALSGKEIGWDQFPFKRTAVIVFAVEMSYETHTTAPSYLNTSSASEGYTQMSKIGYQLSVFLKNLGYKAVASGNDLAANVPYAIQAGLGESSRSGLLVTYKYGPRVRLAKVFVDLDFVEFDKPITFGVRNFCERCQICAETCPAECISKDEKPSMAPPVTSDFDTSYVNPGVEKWYVDAKKCLLFWGKSNTACGACIASCPYNKPDFWQHRMVDKLAAIMPKQVHPVMREMDKLFGYGDLYDNEAGKKFWSSKGRKYLGYK
jgi:reductive dehalogenase